MSGVAYLLSYLIPFPIALLLVGAMEMGLLIGLLVWALTGKGDQDGGSKIS